MSRTRRKYRKKKSKDDNPIGALLVIFLVFGSSILAWFSQRPIATILLIGGIGITLFGLVVSSFARFRLREHETRYRLIAEGNWLRLNPYQFEEYVAEIFKVFGYRASTTRSSGDGGFDIRVEKNGKAAIVECKRFKPTNRVGVKLIREFESVVNYNQVDGGYFVTTSSFTQPAIDWANKTSTPITLIDGDDLAEWMQEARFGPYALEDAQSPAFWTILWRVSRMIMWTGATLLIIFIIYVVGWYFGTVGLTIATHNTP